jgi:hypothetical protein
LVASVPFLAEEEEAVHPDGWVPLSEGEVERRGYRFGEKVSGPRAVLGLGQKGFPGALSYFSLFSFFSFSVFLISFISFA